MTTKPLYDPYSPELRADPYPVYRELRDKAPVYYNEELDFWTLSRFADVLQALKKPLLYSSAQGIAVGMTSEMTSVFEAVITMDPPRHTQMRLLVNHAFTPRRIAALEPRILEVATALIDDCIEKETCDLVGDFAAQLPTIVIAELLGVPTEDQKMFKEKSNALVNQQRRPGEVPDPAQMTPVLELVMYLNDVYDQRRKQPRDDLMSALLAAEVDGQKLSQSELTGFALLLLIAGNETTTNLLGNGIQLMYDHPDQRARLVANPQALPDAIEEFLRYESPIPGLARTLTEDLDFRGHPFRKGQKVMLLYGSANRDERQFEAPDVFDTSRAPTQHLAFGFGAHFCLGASLARLEARIGFEQLLARRPEYTLPGGAVRNAGGIRGFAQLPAELATGATHSQLAAADRPQ